MLLCCAVCCCTADCVQYLTHALELKDSYKLLKPHVEGLLVQVGEGGGGAVVTTTHCFAQARDVRSHTRVPVGCTQYLP